jgi:hypothetical protein
MTSSDRTRLLEALASLKAHLPTVYHRGPPDRLELLNEFIGTQIERLRPADIVFAYDGRVCAIGPAVEVKTFACRSKGLLAAYSAIQRHLRGDRTPVRAGDFVKGATSPRTAGDSVRHGIARAAEKAEAAGCLELAQALREWVHAGRDGAVTYTPPAGAPRFVTD